MTCPTRSLASLVHDSSDRCVSSLDDLRSFSEVLLSPGRAELADMVMSEIPVAGAGSREMERQT